MIKPNASDFCNSVDSQTENFSMRVYVCVVKGNEKFQLAMYTCNKREEGILTTRQVHGHLVKSRSKLLLVHLFVHYLLWLLFLNVTLHSAYTGVHDVIQYITVMHYKMGISITSHWT